MTNILNADISKIQEIHQYFVLTLRNRGYGLFDTERLDDVRLLGAFAKWNNFIMDNGRKDLFLVVHVIIPAKEDDFFNIWIDKKWSDELHLDRMGNGFIHKSIYTKEDADKILEILEMAE